ncbi:protein tipE isoform X2 [Schistocerca piceifrons]|uniref:protein tipE n=1 Tax=Schistocerca cancellata TaxID=274614 RepID=UPI001F5EE5C8|nr:protein tipE isoform X2 [Schistocerca piceifrons]XP_049783493.1 protein tipE [Schistocerca cancellata]XP_049783494.1 protein tipE [Schistocerca cancellata]XP_049783495.1 protein tipE [Schistocerca cancellata]XP_049783496.1 protein tipE [Schistocerca cancellata]XP_049783497.1 protein tipE [Schistocerca cancellata]XP_049783499.1 protein tipE [Schistocerca cancellata]XP_049783500.1 protein tipE [Schistocerca cancellata]XP_049783501.1 protein tipE [Schistocerca cancellata]XP_049783502.1 pro
MAEEPEVIPPTFLQKLLFYTTAFFILLGTFSLFAFLFLVPFVIDPAFTTIFMEFDTNPAWCQTVDTLKQQGVSNCTWSSCREGCTKEVYECTQIRVNYKLRPSEGEEGGEERKAEEDGDARVERALRDYEYFEPQKEEDDEADFSGDEDQPLEPRTGLMGNDSEWYFTFAKLFPNVKGCGYPPMLNCTIFVGLYETPGTNFSCYYSKVDPGLVISDLDMHQVYMNLVYAMAIPIPSFIISVIYLTFAYFVIYNEEPEEALVDGGGDADVDGEGGTATPLPPALTPASDAFREDLASFGHQLKVAMADELSRESVPDVVANSTSVPGSLGKTMATSIPTPGGPIADV